MASNSNDGKDMQVDEDDFMLSLSPTQGTGNGNNEVIATEVMSLPADLDVTDLENNSQLWLSLEGSLSGAQDLEAVAALSSVAHEDMGDAIVSHGGLTEDMLTQSEASNLIEVETVEMAPVEDSTMDHQETVSTSNVEEIAAEVRNAVEETPSTAAETVINVPEVAKVAVTPSTQQNQTYLSMQSPAAGTGNSQGGIRVVTTANVTAKGLAAIASSPSTSVQQPLRLLSPAKTITLQQAQQLGLFSPKKGQTIAISRVAVSSSGTLTTAVASSSAAVALGKQQPAKLAVGNVTLVKNPLLRTPTKIAPAPPQQLANPQQPGNLFIKNATAVTMATLVTKPGTTHLASSSPQKIVLRPATPGSTTTSPARVAVSGQPAQYIRLTTAQAVAAGILPGVSGTPTGSGQIQLGGSKIQLVRLVTPGTGTAATSTAATPGSPGVVSTATPTLKVATKTAGGTVSKVTTPVKSLVSPASATPGGQRLLLPAGSINSLGGGNLVVVPAQYVAQQQIPATSTATTPVQPLVTAASEASATAVTPDLGKQPSAVKNLQAKLSAERSPTENNTSLNQGSNKQSALDANGIKPRKPCNCTKSQCLKLYCDCFANGEFCNGCNCVSCANNLEHEELRSRAVRACLDRNPHAFKPKIGVSWGPEPRRHNKGCHCKRSGCLKNYCECYEAKIACTAICKCIGCKNCFDSLSPSATTPEKKTAKLGVLPAFTPLPETPLPVTVKIEERSDEPPSKTLAPLSATGTRPAFSFITQEVVEATCQCLLAQVEEAEKSGKDSVAAEGMVLEEFGRCLLQIIEYASRAKGTTSP